MAIIVAAKKRPRGSSSRARTATAEASTTLTTITSNIANRNRSRSSRKTNRKMKSTILYNVVVAGLSVSLLMATIYGWIAADRATTETAAFEEDRLLEETGQQQQQQDEESSSSSSIAVNVTFEDILKTIVFLIVTWGSANICRIIGLPSLAGEIISGMILGPPVLDFCPYPEAMVLIGNFGLIGLILNSGIDLDIAQLRETGTRAVMIAVSGTALALSSGIGVSYLVGIDRIQEAFSIGAIFAPSSWGVASQVLSKGEVLNTPTGQTIMASSVVDDILGLILLSILQVFVMADPTIFDYIRPFITSFGYLIVLGGLGITVIPRVIENQILPRLPEEKRDFAAIAMMFCLMTAYLPLMYYSGASFLTGAFLAGVSFSQLNQVHATFANSSHELMVWLMRIFFAATIGFQVPARYFQDPFVLGMGCIFLFPIVAKIPLGFLIPRFQREIPADFPYDPYYRDLAITSLSMVCRGEFNFVVASVALQSGLLSAEHYAGTVFAVLISAIVGPLILSRVIAYYNQKSLDYLDTSHPIKRIGTSGDGYRPLFLAVQARTPVHWGMHDKLKHALEDAGLIIIDHRSWHSMGRNAVNVTEIFCQDKEIQVKIKGCFATENEKESTRSRARRTEAGSNRKSGRLSKTPTPASLAETFSSSESPSSTGPDEDFMLLVAERKAEIEEIIATAFDLDKSEYAIQVSEWQTFSFEQQQDPENGLPSNGQKEQGYCFHSIPQDHDNEDDNISGIDNENPESEAMDSTKAEVWKPSFFRSKSNASTSEDIQPTPKSTGGEEGHRRTPSFFRSKSNASTEDIQIPPKPKLSRGVSNASSAGGEKGHRRTPSRGHRRNNTGVSLTGSVIHVAQDPVLTGRDLWETDEGCHGVVREGYYQTRSNGTNDFCIEEGLAVGTGGHHRRSNSSAVFVAVDDNEGNRSRVDSRSSFQVPTDDNGGNRSRLDSRSSFNVHLEDNGGNRSRLDSRASILFLDDDDCHDADEENPISPSNTHDVSPSPDVRLAGADGISSSLVETISNIPRPRPIHERSVTFDVGQFTAVSDSLRDLETEKIKERLHGYVRHL